MNSSRRNFVKKSALGAAGLTVGAYKVESIRSVFGNNSKTDIKNQSIDLLKDEAVWSTFSPREEITPFFSLTSKDGNNKPVLAINGNNNTYSVGCWLRKLPALQNGRRYRIEALFKIDQVENLSKSIRAVVMKDRSEFFDLYDLEKIDNGIMLSGELTPEKDEEGLEVGLFLMESEKGTVYWNDVSLTDITETFRPQLANLAAISGRPSNPKNRAGAIEFYCDRIDKMDNKDLDLICMGELINVDGVPGHWERIAETIPGPTTSRLGEKAKEYHTYIAASLLERKGKLIYNTAVLIDRNGNVAGKAPKVHLTIGEQLIKGIKPGKDYPVFQTDFGKVGLLVCWDNHFPEASRILAVKGADIIAYPNWGDARKSEGGVWEPYIRTRAIDNHLSIVSAVNGGRSCIVDGGGNILAINKYAEEEPVNIVRATVDLNASVKDYTNRTIQKRYLLWRRPETYSALTKHVWDFK